MGRGRWVGRGVVWGLAAGVPLVFLGIFFAYPVVTLVARGFVTDVALPDSWLKFAPLAPEPFTVDPSLISQNRDGWIQTWTDTVIG